MVGFTGSTRVFAKMLSRDRLATAKSRPADGALERSPSAEWEAFAWEPAARSSRSSSRWDPFRNVFGRKGSKSKRPSSMSSSSSSSSALVVNPAPEAVQEPEPAKPSYRVVRRNSDPAILAKAQIFLNAAQNEAETVAYEREVSKTRRPSREVTVDHQAAALAAQSPGLLRLRGMAPNSPTSPTAGDGETTGSVIDFWVPSSEEPKVSALQRASSFEQIATKETEAAAAQKAADEFLKKNGLFARVARQLSFDKRTAAKKKHLAEKKKKESASVLAYRTPSLDATPSQSEVVTDSQVPTGWSPAMSQTGLVFEPVYHEPDNLVGVY